MADKRINGIDMARAVAVIGMIIVNFKIVLGGEGLFWVKSLAGVLEGKAAATFVVLAGVGLALMTKAAGKNNDRQKLKITRKRILKRAIFLFIVGLSYIPVWPADILHFYGIYMLVVLLFLNSSNGNILIAVIILILLYPGLMLFWDYEAGWNFTTLNYVDFWTVKGFVRNLFYNGFHPVLPWAAFMLFGFWFGKQDLTNESLVKKALKVSLVAFVVIQGFSMIALSWLQNSPVDQELMLFLETKPMPPLPLYMFNGIAIAIIVISGCILIGNRYNNNKVVVILNQTGKLALTFYVAHVIIGMGVIEVLNPGKLGTYSVEFSVAYALLFSILCLLFASIWLSYKKTGPLEWLMRKLTD